MRDEIPDTQLVDADTMHVSVKHAVSGFRVPLFSYESFWGAGAAWDYLTEENAARSIEFLAEQVAYQAEFAERINARVSGGT